MALDVLIVDDSAAIRKILQRVLAQAEISLSNVYEAGDGLEALDVLKANRVDLVLADINMPKMDGIQLLREIKTDERWAGIPVVMVTTEGGQSKVIAAAEIGAAGYVRKPFTADQIRRTLEPILAA
ncbi:MAG: response regulator [bacterium]|jgi:two-component system chemotaxis response regulator CheY